MTRRTNDITLREAARELRRRWPLIVSILRGHQTVYHTRIIDGFLPVGPNACLTDVHLTFPFTSPEAREEVAVKVAVMLIEEQTQLVEEQTEQAYQQLLAAMARQ